MGKIIQMKLIAMIGPVRIFILVVIVFGVVQMEQMKRTVHDRCVLHIFYLVYHHRIIVSHVYHPCRSFFRDCGVVTRNGEFAA